MITPSVEPVKTSENSPLRTPDGKLIPGGPSLNPSGRPPSGVSITDAIKKKLLEKYVPKKCRCDCHRQKTMIDNKTVEPGNPQSVSCFNCEEKHEEIEADIKEARTFLEKVIITLFQNAIEKGDQKTLKDIWSYIDGLPKGSFDLGVDREGLAQLTEVFRKIAEPKPKDDKPK